VAVHSHARAHTKYTAKNDKIYETFQTARKRKDKKRITNHKTKGSGKYNNKIGTVFSRVNTGRFVFANFETKNCKIGRVGLKISVCPHVHT
jgi:hypothetical protein